MSEIPEDIKPVGYVIKNELTKLRLGVSCVDLFGQVVPKGFEMVPLYSAPVDLTEERDRLREALQKAEPYVEICHSLMTGTEPRKSVWLVLKQVRAALSPPTAEGV